MQGLKTFAGVDVQQMSDDKFRRQIFRVLNMDASTPADSKVFTQQRALRKYIADSGLTEVVQPDGRQHTLKHGNVLVEAIAAGVEPLEFRRTVERKMRFNLVTIEPNALLNIVAKQRRDKKALRQTMLNVGKRKNGVTLGRWLLRGPSRKEVLLTTTTHVRVPRPLV